MQGVGNHVKGTTTIFIQTVWKITKYRRKDVAYVHIVVDYIPTRYDPNRVCLKVGGNLINYSRDMQNPTMDLNT